jgi:hypothetical protein
MPTNNIYLTTWVALAGATLALAVYRIFLDHHEHHSAQLTAGEHQTMALQTHGTGRTHTVTRWGEGLTIIVTVYGLVLLAIWAFRIWLRFYYNVP